VKRLRWALPAGLATLAVLLTVGCSSSGPHKGTSSTAVSLSKSVPPPASSARLSSIPVGPSSSASTPTDPATRAASDALATAQELTGGSFTELPYAETPIPQPCTAPSTAPVLTQVPPKIHVGRQFSLADPEAVLTEDIYLYASAARAKQLVSAIEAGFACTNGTVQLSGGSGQKVAVDGPASLTSLIAVPGVTVTGWTMQNGQLSRTFTIGYAKNYVVALGFLAPSTSDLSKAPDGPTIARIALRKVRAAKLGG
jgi:hypothetical protein